MTPSEAALLRVALPAAKFWICKRTPMITAEALECLGGNGYVEDYSAMPRLLRDSPLNSIWEGSGNVTALDVLRALARTPDSADAVLAEIDLAASDPRVARGGGEPAPGPQGGRERTGQTRSATPGGWPASSS